MGGKEARFDSGARERHLIIPYDIARMCGAMSMQTIVGKQASLRHQSRRTRAMRSTKIGAKAQARHGRSLNLEPFDWQT